MSGARIDRALAHWALGHRTLARRQRLALGAAALLLCACVTVPPSPPLRPWTQRAAQLQAVQHFMLSGRLAASHGKEGFSAGVQWQQQDSDATLELSGPLGFGAVHVQQQGEQLRITTANGTTLDGEAAEAQLVRILGFDPPLRSLRYWVLGVNDPRMSAQRSLDADQRLLQLWQDGWRVDYQEYTAVQRSWLPRRLTVSREQLRLRLVIDVWQL